MNEVTADWRSKSPLSVCFSLALQVQILRCWLASLLLLPSPRSGYCPHSYPRPKEISIPEQKVIAEEVLKCHLLEPDVGTGRTSERAVLEGSEGAQWRLPCWRQKKEEP